MYKNIILIFITSLLFVSCNGQTPNNLQLLSSSQYEQAIAKNNVTIIDVRTPSEYQEGHIENAQNINVQSADFKSKMENFDKTKPIYIYCRSGARSAKAARIMEEMGFKEIYDLNGGILSWKGVLKK